MKLLTIVFLLLCLFICSCNTVFKANIPLGNIVSIKTFDVKGRTVGRQINTDNAVILLIGDSYSTAIVDNLIPSNKIGLYIGTEEFPDYLYKFALF